MILCEHPKFIYNKSLKNLSHWHKLQKLYDGSPFHGNVDKEAINENNVDCYQVLDTVTGELLPMFLEVPCNHCKLCQDKRRQSIVRRMNYEFLTVKNGNVSLFVSLTQDDPCLHALTKKDIQNFVKRVREYQEKQTGKRLNIRYFACGELGSGKGSRRKGENPHYHLIIFNYPKLENWYDYKAAIQARWPYGFVNVQIISEKNDIQKNRTKISYQGAFRYVAKYCCKSEESTSSFGKEFQLWSKGLGSEFIGKLRNQILREPTIKDLQYFDYESGQYKQIVVDKAFLYYIFMKKHYNKYLESRKYIENYADVDTRDIVRRLVFDGAIDPKYIGNIVAHPVTDWQSKVLLQQCVDNLVKYTDLQQRCSVFISSNVKQQDKKTFKELRDLRLRYIEENMNRRLEKEIL